MQKAQDFRLEASGSNRSRLAQLSIILTLTKAPICETADNYSTWTVKKQYSKDKESTVA